jgi:putative DNA primase/helicase
MGIFSEHAPLYWSAGLPVIPLLKWNSSKRGAGKAPDIPGWEKYCSEMPSVEVQAYWLRTFPDHNIGLPLGRCSGLCAVDIDTDDPDETAVIKSLLPDSPYERIGKKGSVLLYRWNGQKNFKLRLPDGRQPVEFLGDGNQVVVPPSIHPETGRPYTATANLWEIV